MARTTYPDHTKSRLLIAVLHTDDIVFLDIADPCNPGAQRADFNGSGRMVERDARHTHAPNFHFELEVDT